MSSVGASMPETTHSFNTYIFRVLAATMGANLFGALLTFLFFTVILPLPTGSRTVRALSYDELYIFCGFMAGVFLLATIWNLRSNTILGRWHTRLRLGQATSDQVPPPVLRLALNYVPQTTLIGLVMWVMAGLFFGRPAANGVLQEALITIGGIIGVGGMLTTALTYFVIDLLWRPILPAFFPDGRLSRIRAFRLPVLNRLLVVFGLAAILPAALLVALSMQRAGSLLSAPNPHAVLDNMLILELFILGAGLVLGIGMAVFMTRGITRPLYQLQAAMSHVEQNDLDTSVPVTGNDELGYLAERFNQMTAGLRQGEMTRNLLNLYVTPEVAHEAIEHGARLGGQLVECTVLFSDIRGFTSLTEKLPPEELISLVNRYMTAMVAVIVENGGMVNKFGGDSLLALFGTPLNPAPAHAARALRAALGMRHALEQFNWAQATAGGPTLRIGIGVATGPVVAGNVGGQERIEYTVIGDTVNLAARLQEQTKEMENDILISAECYAAANSAVALEVERVPELAVRGKSEPVEAYVVRGGAFQG